MAQVELRLSSKVQKETGMSEILIRFFLGSKFSVRAKSLTVFDIYTLPHTEEDVLMKLTVTALDANDNIIKERVFENVPVTRNQITRYTGSFFDNGGNGQQSDGTLRLTAKIPPKTRENVV